MISSNPSYQHAAGAEYYAPAGILDIPNWPSSPRPEGSGPSKGSSLVLLGLGKAGEQIVKRFLLRTHQYQVGFDWDLTLAIVALASSTQRIDDTPLGPYPCERILLTPGTGMERHQIGTTLQQNEFDRLRTFLDKKLEKFLTEAKEIRHIIVASLTEPEIGLLGPILELLTKPNGTKDRTLFLSLSGPLGARLPQEHQYAAIREIEHYLQSGNHRVVSGSGIRPDKMLEKAFVFGGSSRSDDFNRIDSPAIAESILSLFFESAEMRGEFNRRQEDQTGVKSLEAPDVRCIGIRSLAVPVFELCDYFAWKIVSGSLQRGELLYGTYPPDASTRVNRIYSGLIKGEQRNMLIRWLGSYDLVGWLLKGNSRPSTFDEASTYESLVRGVTEQLTETNQPDRHLVAYFGISFIADRMHQENAFVSFQRKCQSLMAAIQRLFDEGQKLNSYWKTQGDIYKSRLEETARGEVIRWNSAHPVDRADQIYRSLFGSNEKLKDILIRQGVFCSQNEKKEIFWGPLCVPAYRDGSHHLADVLYTDPEKYLSAVFSLARELAFQELLKENPELEFLNPASILHLAAAEQPCAGMVDELSADKKRCFLITADPAAKDEVKDKVFKYANSATRIARPDTKLLTALTMFSPLEMMKFRAINESAQVYVPREQYHLDGHLKNAAYFEGQMRELEIEGGNALLCDEIIMYLENRLALIAFFKAFFSDILHWDRKKKVWRIDEVQADDGDSYKSILLGSSRSDDLKASDEENIESLLEAYKQFSVFVSIGLPEGALQHPLHVLNREKYFHAIISRAAHTKPLPGRKDWLAEEIQPNLSSPANPAPIFDFYRLSQVVWHSKTKGD